MRSPDITQTGIMFDPSRGGFPSLSRVAYLFGADLADWGNWLVVASDPHCYRYADDDAEAMDQTNWDAIVGELPDGEPEMVNPYSGLPTMEEEIRAAGYGIWRDSPAYLLIVAPDNADLIDTMTDLHGQLEDYPLLDESAYSEREYETWQQWVMTGGLESDTTRDLIDAGADEDTIDLLSDQWSDVAPIIASRLDYWNGFTGECGPEFHIATAECIAQGIGAALLGGLRLTY